MEPLYMMCIFCSIIHVIIADCSTVYPGTPTFGSDCTYRCRCKDDVKCEPSTGACPDGCAVDWMGPGCQYRNIVTNYIDVRQFGDSMNEEEGASMAVDGDVSTCSWTDARDYEGQHHWMVQLDRPYRIVGLVLRIPDSNIEQFAEFRVEFGEFWSFFSDVCYQHPDTSGSHVMEVMCEQPMVTQYLRIVLNISNIPLSLCEVEIYGGRVVSFNRPTSGSTWYQNWLPYKVVDGHFLEYTEMTEDARSKTCYASVNVRKPSWTLNLGLVYDIHDVYYYGRENTYLNQMEGFVISISESRSNYTEIYEDHKEDTEYIPRVTTFTEIFPGSNVKVSKRQTSFSQLVICELIVFADCPVDKCGWDCSLDCRCTSPDITGTYKITGTCPVGCRDRWTGVNGRCNIECCLTMWGPECERPCGHCLTLPCDIIEGICLDGCTGAWKPPICVDECDDGIFGRNCSFECGHCKGLYPCDKTTGYCLTECEDGWIPPYCNEEDVGALHPFTVEVGVGAGLLTLAVLVETVTILILCKRRQTRLATKNTGENIQTSVFRKDVTI